MASKRQKHRLIKIFGGNLWQAQLIQGLLEANNIPSMLRNETISAVTSPYATLGGEVCVIIDEKDREMARAVLKKECVSSSPYN